MNVQEYRTQITPQPFLLYYRRDDPYATREFITNEKLVHTSRSSSIEDAFVFKYRKDAMECFLNGYDCDLDHAERYFVAELNTDGDDVKVSTITRIVDLMIEIIKIEWEIY